MTSLRIIGVVAALGLVPVACFGGSSGGGGGTGVGGASFSGSDCPSVCSAIARDCSGTTTVCESECGEEITDASNSGCGDEWLALQSCCIGADYASVCAGSDVDIKRCFSACPSEKADFDDCQANSSTSGSSSSGSTSSSSGGDPNCSQVCNDLYDCGLLSDGSGPLCPGFDGSSTQRLGFLNGDPTDPLDDGCLQQCADLPALALLVDPNDCATTVASLRGASTDFAVLCDGGL
jgi:hypothetical protein